MYTMHTIPTIFAVIWSVLFLILGATLYAMWRDGGPNP